MLRRLLPLFAIATLSACSSGEIPIGRIIRELVSRSDGGSSGDGQTCSWQGTAYQGFDAPSSYDVGEEFESPDSCKECSCTADGILCTVDACEPCTAEALICPDGSAVGRTGRTASLRRVRARASHARTTARCAPMAAWSDAKGPTASSRLAPQRSLARKKPSSVPTGASSDGSFRTASSHRAPPRRSLARKRPSSAPTAARSGARAPTASSHRARKCSCALEPSSRVNRRRRRRWPRPAPHR